MGFKHGLQVQLLDSQPLVSCGAAQSVAGHDRRYAFSLKNAFTAILRMASLVFRS